MYNLPIFYFIWKIFYLPTKFIFCSKILRFCVIIVGKGVDF